MSTTNQHILQLKGAQSTTASEIESVQEREQGTGSYSPYDAIHLLGILHCESRYSGELGDEVEELEIVFRWIFRLAVDFDGQCVQSREER